MVRNKRLYMRNYMRKYRKIRDYDLLDRENHIKRAKLQRERLKTYLGSRETYEILTTKDDKSLEILLNKELKRLKLA